MFTLARPFSVLVLLLALVGCEERLTLTNYEQIENGMTVAEVEGLLGPGQEQTSGGFGIGAEGLVSGSDGGGSQKVLTWEEGGKTVIVTFSDNQVVGRRKDGF